MLNVQAPAPEQSPCHPPKLLFASGVASSTTFPPGMLCWQSAWQENDGAALCTVPLPAMRTVSACAVDPPPPLPPPSGWEEPELLPHETQTNPTHSQPIARMSATPAQPCSLPQRVSVNRRKQRTGRRSTLALERGERKLCFMRLRWIGVGLLALSACARSEAEDVASAPPSRAENVRVSRADEVDALAGYVTARESGVLKLDSGGPTPIELRVDPN